MFFFFLTDQQGSGFTPRLWKDLLDDYDHLDTLHIYGAPGPSKSNPMVYKGMSLGWSIPANPPFLIYFFKVTFLFMGDPQAVLTRWGVVGSCILAFCLPALLPKERGGFGGNDDQNNSSPISEAFDQVCDDNLSSTLGDAFVDPVASLTLVSDSHICFGFERFRKAINYLLI